MSYIIRKFSDCFSFNVSIESGQFEYTVYRSEKNDIKVVQHLFFPRQFISYVRTPFYVGHMTCGIQVSRSWTCEIGQ
jgi:hypothetical protein